MDRRVCTVERYRGFVGEQGSLKALIEEFPEEWREAHGELEALLPTLAQGSLQKYHQGVQAHHQRLIKSGLNTQVLQDVFPRLVKGRMITLALKNYSLAARSGSSGAVKFKPWSAKILQFLLFKGPGLERKAYSPVLYALLWPLVTQKKFLMPLVNKQGIYCFYSKTFIKGLKARIQGRRCSEIAAGDGTLTRLLGQAGVRVQASDDHSWKEFIKYPDFVEALEARKALEIQKPQVVICSWPAPGNSFEAAVFRTSSVETYIVIGSRTLGAVGNPQAYEAQEDFEMSEDLGLSRALAPRELQNQVLVFQRKKP